MIEVGTANNLGGAFGLERDRVGEATAAQSREHVKSIRAGVDRRKFSESTARERSGGDSGCRLPSSDDG